MGFVLGHTVQLVPHWVFSSGWLGRFGCFLVGITMAPKKRLKSTVASTSRAATARGNSSIRHVLNKYNIVFMDAEHTCHCDAIVSRKICAPSYLDVEILATLHLYNDLLILLRNLG